MKLKLNFKFLITLLIVLLFFSTSYCFATNSSDVNNTTSESNTEVQNNFITDSDVYVSDKSTYDIKNIINGNAFASVDTLNIDPNTSGGVIEGNIFAVANNVNIKSDFTYSDTETDDLGNPAITVNKISNVSGNVFVTANKFVLDPGCKIDGDLYICANEVELGQNAVISGNVFVVSNKLNVNSEIGKDLYANVKDFNMKYFGFISRDLHLTAENATLNGYVYRSSFINAKDIITNDKFVNQKNFNVTDADNLTFSGEVDGNANLNVKNIIIKNIENDTNLTCKISGNLSYSSNEEIEISDGIINGDVTYSKYEDTTSKSTLSYIWNYLISLLTTLVCVYVIYLILSKLIPNYLDKFSNISGIDLLKYFGIGILALILIPAISILLFITNIGSILGLILLLIYIILLVVSKSIAIILISKFTKSKLSNNINIYIFMLITTVILSLIKLIPYLGLIVSVVIWLIGLGSIVRNLTYKKKINAEK